MDIIIGDFELYLHFQRQSATPQRIFKSQADLIVALAKLDDLLAQTVAQELHVELILDDVQVGSLRSKLAMLLREVPDEAIKDFDWQKLVGHFLLKAKYVLLKHLEDTGEFTSGQQIKAIQQEIQSLAEPTQPNQLTVAGQIPLDKLTGFIESIVRSVSPLSSGDYVEYRSAVGNVRLNPNFNTSNLNALVAADAQTTEHEYLMKIKRADFLGDSMWDFMLRGRMISAKIVDNDWLVEFHEGRINILPGDSLLARLRTEYTYGPNFRNAQEHHTVLKVLDVIRH
ncbi:hypothetical protein D0N36_03685 [Hymenobacter lapidiphilus]|uniref:hypothetical protein n=1 Tax=Hymenobacter sp. CCM 8763 TaxID=2303334 RepID=UPI000E340A15|nr:hypothetical protein [Hymenobacter sp. CCM 8763]RFP66459.1 hypothetical protein D0N36_03685 [Hymenobacter sp. CCM 8763]